MENSAWFVSLMGMSREWREDLNQGVSPKKTKDQVIPLYIKKQPVSLLKKLQQISKNWIKRS